MCPGLLVILSKRASARAAKDLSAPIRAARARSGRALKRERRASEFTDFWLHQLRNSGTALMELALSAAKGRRALCLCRKRRGQPPLALARRVWRLLERVSKMVETPAFRPVNLDNQEGAALAAAGSRTPISGAKALSREGSGSPAYRTREKIQPPFQRGGRTGAQRKNTKENKGELRFSSVSSVSSVVQVLEFLSASTGPCFHPAARTQTAKPVVLAANGKPQTANSGPCNFSAIRGGLC